MISKLNRRSFLKLLGGGTAALGMGISGNAWAAQSGSAQAQKQAEKQKIPDDFWDCDAWEIYYPGKYDPEHAKALKENQANLDKINERGDIDVKDLVSGKLEGTPGIGGRGPGGTKITLENMMSLASRAGCRNPLYTDKNYAKKTKYGDLIAFPLVTEPGGWPSTPVGLGDYLLVSDLNVTVTNYKPVYEGDTLYTVLDKQDCEDITPAAGSHYRTFALSGIGRTFNQKGELVAEGSHMVKESYRRRKDPAKRTKASNWESPQWWFLRPPHTYTDQDWDYIISIWKNEKIRGDNPRYWDDVNIGDEPTPTLIPALGDTVTDMLGLQIQVAQWAVDMKLDVLNPNTFAKMVKNEQGIYVLPQYLEKKPGIGFKETEINRRDFRAALQNAVAARWAAAMLCDWMGDEGWLQRFGWDIMAEPAGYPEYVIPPYPKRTTLYDKFPYMEKVPYMKGKRADCHGLENDFVISKAYVTDKHAKNGEYFVDLTWWCETVDKYLIEEGFATVKLPKK